MKVYDLTDFKSDHPGGAKVIMLYAGRDASQEFNMLHPPTLDISKYIGAEFCIGTVKNYKPLPGMGTKM